MDKVTYVVKFEVDPNAFETAEQLANTLKGAIFDDDEMDIERLITYVTEISAE